MKLLFPAMVESFAHPSVLLFPYASLYELAKEEFPFQKIVFSFPHIMRDPLLLSEEIFLCPAKMFAFVLPFSVLF